MTNIGTRPTVNGRSLTIEPWLLDYAGDLYGQPVTLELWHYLRGERRFAGLEALKERSIQTQTKPEPFCRLPRCTEGAASVSTASIRKERGGACYDAQHAPPRYAVNRKFMRTFSLFLRPPLQNSLSFDMMCVKMQRERREKPMSPQNHDTQDYYDRPLCAGSAGKRPPGRNSRRLTSRYCCSYWASRQSSPSSSGGVKLISRNDKTDPSAGAATGQTAPSNEENQTLLAEAAILAAQYDYDGALTLLGTCTGEDDRVAQAVADYTAAKEGLTVWEDVGEIPLISFQPLIADPSRAFDGDDNADYYDRNSLTTSEFSAILDQLYEKGYVLVSMEDLAAPDETGVYKAGKILLPEGKAADPLPWCRSIIRRSWPPTASPGGWWPEAAARSSASTWTQTATG